VPRGQSNVAVMGLAPVLQSWTSGRDFAQFPRQRGCQPVSRVLGRTTCVRPGGLTSKTGIRLRVRCADSGANFSLIEGPGQPDTTEHMVGAPQMTDIATTSNRKLEDSRETSPVTSATNPTEAQALITEQQVLFSTAAAVALPPAKTRCWSDTIQAVSAALRTVFAAPEKPRARRHYPKRYGYLENALMSREMDRL
jgi:hypothetical protein